MSKEDVATPVLEALKREFFGMMKTKNLQYIDNKVRNVRYLAELVKFGVAPPITAFRMFKTMMADFSPHNIELVAILLESCGRCVSEPQSPSFHISLRLSFRHYLKGKEAYLTHYSMLPDIFHRYLYLLPYTHERTCDVIEMMLRLRRAKNLDLRLQVKFFTILLSDFLHCHPCR